MSAVTTGIKKIKVKLKKVLGSLFGYKLPAVLRMCIRTDELKRAKTEDPP